MAILVANCPRCRSSNMTFDAFKAIPIGVQYDWQHWYEVFCVCRHCNRSTIFVLVQKNARDGDTLIEHPPTEMKGSLNPIFSVDGYISVKDFGAAAPPEHVPNPVANAFREGATSGRRYVPSCH